jgi:hypothetical protein
MLARDLRVNAGRKHLSGMAVAQIVEADMGPLGRLQEHCKGMTDAVGLQDFSSIFCLDSLWVKSQN